MPSPFPGMDPYLEAPDLWPGLHQSLITYIRDELQPDLRPTYHARIGERVYVVETGRHIYPDVAIIRRPQPEREPVLAGGPAPAAAATLVADEPLTVTIPPVEYREPFIEIVHTAGGQVVTVIEVLSPANKTAGQGHDLYRQKQAELLKSPAHLMEIDLLSQGLHTVALPAANLAELPPHRYLVCVTRAPEHYDFELYPVSLTERLPRCRLPLKPPSPDIVLDLPTIFNRCYDNGGYPDFVNYTQPPAASLSEEEQAWVAENVK